MTDNILISLLTLVALLFVGLIKNKYTLKVLTKTIDLIGDYCKNLVSNGEYDSDFEYFDEMLVSYSAYFFNPFAFGKYKGIKRKYRKLLKDFDKTG